ncbi:hypothetical protein PAUR_b0501 [Pseudoalteromonas aurantia 208]|uniref:Uncharacterized protein n=1 Tax=Pseudoalteromonas aurantia 208 TaxID=1314867 RepID=A0ABR9EL58_9GAMM|nr:hypothetical protein [Pseudoalteromonas aurantia 208]
MFPIPKPLSKPEVSYVFAIDALQQSFCHDGFELVEVYLARLLSGFS